MARKVVVIGCGTVGGILAAHLAASGSEVYVVDAAMEIVDAVNRDGLHISGVLDRRSRVAQVFPSMLEAKGVDPDYVFVCVKTTALRKLAPMLAVFEAGRASVVSVQNGIDTEEALAEHFPRGRILRVVVNFAGGMLKPGSVHAAFFHPPNVAGPVEPSGAAAAKDIAELFTAAGLKTEAVDIVKKAAWRKAILNSALMPVSVLTGMTMKLIMELPATRGIVERQIRDFLKVAEAEGHVYEGDFMDKALRYLSDAGDHKPSMLVDFEAGRPLEIDFLNGKIQRYADKHGVPCETNRLLLSLVEGALRRRELEKLSSSRSA